MTMVSPTPGEPSALDALIALAQREFGAGRLVEAAAAYGKILAIRPNIAEAHNDLGTILARQGKFEEAAAQYERAAALKPGLYQAYNSLGNILWKQGKLDGAVVRLEQALALRPDLVEARNSLGTILAQQGRLEEAVNQYERVVALKPDLAEAHNNLGNVLWQQGKLNLAIARYQQAIILRPEYAEAHNNLGNTLLSLGRLDDAARWFEQALVLRPEYPEAHSNLGNLLRKQGKLDQAIGRYQQALALRPDYAEVHYNLGFTLRDQGKLEEAAARYENALALRPDYPDARLGLATCYLVEGDFERGWPAYEERLRIRGFVNLPNLPRWTGEPLAGRRLLLLAEQGLGDTLHFVRYARLLKEQGARVVLACPSALSRLLATHPDLDELFILGSAKDWPDCEFFLPLVSAPYAFRTDCATIPRKVPYLTADPALTDHWRRKLAALDGFKIGIVWQGSRDYPSDCLRSMPLAEFAPLAGLPGVRLVSLQKGFGSEQVAAVDFPVLDLSDQLDEEAGPFMDTAAVIRSLDLVVAPDTATAHLAGALGAPVSLALQFSPDWRWLLNRDDSPWYPTMRLFRQSTFGQWSDVFDRIANAVKARRSETT